MNNSQVVAVEYRVDEVYSPLDYSTCTGPRAETALFAAQSRHILGTAALQMTISTPRLSRMAEQKRSRNEYAQHRRTLVELYPQAKFFLYRYDHV